MATLRPSSASNVASARWRHGVREARETLFDDDGLAEGFPPFQNRDIGRHLDDLFHDMRCDIRVPRLAEPSISSSHALSEFGRASTVKECLVSSCSAFRLYSPSPLRLPPKKVRPAPRESLNTQCLLPSEDTVGYGAGDEQWRGEVECLLWKPRVFRLKGFLSDDECDHLIRIVRAELPISRMTSVSRSRNPDCRCRRWGIRKRERMFPASTGRAQGPSWNEVRPPSRLGSKYPVSSCQTPTMSSEGSGEEWPRLA